ncbi:putative phage abortive infection protein [Thalassobius sp. Cn5-15]|uniref:putative phage abortive infection protein n=1 Tax=Thalassobius sp. Cn5-15 TaxID=2917763 RepID=UPI001EF1803E|nr:putative phage abortive infection protein [Thalassobius sp. Cn5-15]MCG7492863.1 putative phage abortive infection protein [Thalassobius sp. Cn5-15]
MQRVWPFIWVGLVVAAWLASSWLVQWSVGVDGEVGTFGDSFGALTSLFTGLAFVGLIITLRQQKAQIAMQREDLKLQRGEMKAARAELSGQKEQMELQNQSLKQQMFEQTFFNLLNVFNHYIADLVEKHPGEGSEPQRGRDELERLLHNITLFASSVETGKTQPNVLGGRVPVWREATTEEKFVSLTSRVSSGMLRYSNDLNSYFRLLYNILKLVDHSGVEQKKTYTNILRAQLSDSELQLIALNCARAEAAKLQVFVDRYDILKHLPPKLNGFDIQAVCEELRRQEIEEKTTE